MATPVQDPIRLERRRREHERQQVLFSILIVLLVVATIFAVAIYTGAIEAPFDRAFTASEEETVIPPCLPGIDGSDDGPPPLPYDQVNINIFNGSGHSGVAAANRSVLTQRGFTVGEIGDFTAVIPFSELRFGANGIVAAYTLAAQFPEMRLRLDTREDATVDLIVGERYTRPLDEEDVPLASNEPLHNLPNCQPAESLTPVPAPVPADEEGDSE
ncbi:MAG: LytR C-terminal domain-containing protein [Cellulomonadaceae bacterium]|nr:LytR C-terminal domain-containing protein [Cellulomonadaceae bacterium]